jgi:hypothetical protein
MPASTAKQHYPTGTGQPQFGVPVTTEPKRVAAMLPRVDIGEQILELGRRRTALTAILNLYVAPRRPSCSFWELYNDRYLLRCGPGRGTLATSRLP